MTTEHEASRTLVKSPPELWAECSDAGSLARHLGEFGEIKITRLEPETTVAWEGEHASGTVRIEPSGWGTRVTLTAQTNRLGTDETHLDTDETSPPEKEGGGPPEGQMPEHVEPKPETETPTLQEDDDAPVEETLEDPDPVRLDPTPRSRARWRRLTARVRGFFGPIEPGAAQAAAAPDPPVIAEPEPLLSEPIAGEPVLSEPEPEAEPEPEVQPVPEAALVEPEPAPAPEAEPETTLLEPEGAPVESDLDAEAVLSSALDSLGQAHHRPFSRA